MNEKLKAWQGKLGLMNRTELRCNPSRNIRNELIILTVNKTKKKKNKATSVVMYEYDTLSVTLHPRIVEQAGFKLGDKLELEIKGDEGCLYKNDDTGRCLTNTTPSVNSRRVVRYALPKGRLDGFPQGAAGNVEVTSGLIAFHLPIKTE